MTDVLELTRRLIAAPSPTGREAPAVNLMAEELERLGWNLERQPVAPGRENLYATREPPVVVFTTHLDTVPPWLPPAEDAEWIRGRGACDAKGIAAAMVAAAERLAAGGERRIGLLFVVGEEDGGEGARCAATLEPRGRYVINGEPTENQLVVGSKGALRVDLRARGRAAHSAYPSEGSSAIVALLETLRRIRRSSLPFDPHLGECTLNVGTIAGGVAPNVIAPEACATLLFRTVGPSEPVKAVVLRALEPGVTAEFVYDIPAFHGQRLDGWDSTVVAFASDMPWLGPWGRGFMLGPGTIRLAHTADERIAKRELLDAVNLYVRLAGDLLRLDAAS